VAVLEIERIDEDGEAHARLAEHGAADADLSFRVASGRHAPVIGDRVLARLTIADEDEPRAQVLRILERTPDFLVGIYEGEHRGGGVVRPVDRRVRDMPIVRPDDRRGAEHGELVRVELRRERPLGPPRARVVERLGLAQGPRAISLIAAHQHAIPAEFPAAARREAERARPVTLADGRRADLRALPLVTIDGADARDFDDAVFAARDQDPANAGGWRITVAIADVAHYVRPGGALDRAARERGNSVYFPDRVVPMLPEELSNDLCSLRPRADRACFAAHMRIDAEGDLLDYRFERGLMRSVARLVYEQVQRAKDGFVDDVTAPLREQVIAPLYGAYAVLAAARARRHVLELDLPERKIELDSAGRVVRIASPQRLDSHRLIEEFMILANVAAATELEAKRQPCMYRIHEPPDLAKLAALRPVLAELGVALPPTGVRARDFNRALEQTRDTPYRRLVHELILRTQSQARYSPTNRGHFGLALRRYAHFTSPIRRYADLLVHRALLGPRWPDGAGPRDAAGWEDLGEQISRAERRAMAAERDAANRYIVAFLADRVGAEFAGTITGVTRFGLFVALDETGADGLVPIAALPADYYQLDPAEHRLTGRRTGRSFRLGEPITVRLAEANQVTGSLALGFVEHRPLQAGTARALGRGARRRRR
jgi:ribonuclease R